MPREPVDLKFDRTKMRQDVDKLTRGFLGAGADAVRATTGNLEKDLEALTKANVRGNLWKAWAKRAFPDRGPAKNPVGTIFLKGRDRTDGAIEYFTTPGRTVGKRGQYLAIPLPAAGSRGRLRDLTPGEWERRTGIRLRFVYRPGRASLLVADEAVLSGRGGIARLNTARRRGTGRGNTTVPIFVLIPFQERANRFSIKPTIDASTGALAQAFFDRVRGLV